MLHRRYKVGYALACGNTFDAPRLPFYTLRMAERYADWWRARLSRRYPTNAVYVTDLDNEERGDVYGTDDDN